MLAEANIAVVCFIRLQVLTVGTSNGMISSYLAALPTVYGAHGTRVAHLTSLNEVTVMDTATRGITKVEVACEPAFCVIGPKHLAVGMNNQVSVGRVRRPMA